MTADELVTDLELQSSQMEYGYAVSDWKLLSDAATMLRQQQALIEQLEKTQDYLYKTHDADKAQLAAAEQYYLDAFERGKQIGYADGMMNRTASVQNTEPFIKHEQGK